MKNMKRIASFVLVLVMMLCMATTVFAATGDYTITVTNSVTGKTYNAYKVFDATYDDKNHVAYTIVADQDDSTTSWYDLVSVSDSPFTLTETNEDNKYIVQLATGKSQADVTTWFNAVDKDNIPGSAAATGTGNGGALVLNVSAPGYYYITTTMGATVAVDTADPTGEVREKNTVPGPEKTVSDAEAQIGDSVTYTITANVPSYADGEAVTSYSFSDVLDAGLMPPAASSVNVQILKAGGAVFATIDTNAITVSNQTISFTYYIADYADYPADATLKVEYTAKVDADAAFKNDNAVTQTWGTSSDTSTVTVYTYGFNLVKKDGNGTDAQTLTGAEFALYTANQVEDGTDGKKVLKADATPLNFTKSEDNGTVKYTVVPAGTTDATTIIEAGNPQLFGLDADVTYYLLETKAPAGYNILLDLTEVKVGQENTFSQETGINNDPVVIVNNPGTLLPSTGGIGTTIFYIVGGVLVLAALVLLIVKKRMSTAK